MGKETIFKARSNDASSHTCDQNSFIGLTLGLRRDPLQISLNDKTKNLRFEFLP